MHTPVLLKEVIEYLDPKPNENFIDCTLGDGGHAGVILEKNGPRGKILGIDLEIRTPARERLILAKGNYADLKEIVGKNKFKSVSGILLDLGFSSWHLEQSGRGFSFQKQEPLDMRYGPENRLTAEKILNFWSIQELERILTDFGEERFAKEIAREIINSRQVKPIKNTFQLSEIIKRVVPNWYQRQKINSSTRTFQALRLAVNNELRNLEAVLPQAMEILKKGGKLAVISFHSLEDRIVKNFFRDKAKENLIKILTKKPITASYEEVRNNPRARSAKLRAAIKAMK